ncbi:MAG: hypothetical protein JW883_16690, partial [Deltaproteobacteria bacterium]|nr:hypothetical protein [Deltaproteobacteria bacterium]
GRNHCPRKWVAINRIRFCYFFTTVPILLLLLPGLDVSKKRESTVKKAAIFGFARYPRSPFQADGECGCFCGSSGYDADCGTSPGTRLCLYNDFHVPTEVV